MNTMNPEELLSNSDFVRLLARSLVLDEHSAADIAQDTWVAALEHAPERGGPLRAWLALVTKNFSRKLLRGDTRRRLREHAVAGTTRGLAPSAAEIAEREEMRHRVIEAVQALDEPWRSTILLRYYENLSHRKAAERLGVPIETMRTRLKKGLALLRARLDTEHGGDRQEWRLALAPLAGIDLAGVSPGAASGTAAGLATASGVSVKIIAFFAAALILGTLALVWAFLPPDKELGTDANRVASIASVGERNVVPAEEARASALTGIAERSDEPVEKEAISPSPTEVVWRGRLIEYDGLPKKGVAIELRIVKALLPEDRPGKNIMKESGEDGAFEISGLVPGEYTLFLSFTISAGRQQWIEWGPVVFDTPGTIEKDILVAEGQGAIVAGVVIDEATGLPLRRPLKKPGDLIDFVVRLHNPDLVREVIEVEVDCETGAFCLRNLPFALYNLYLLGPGLNSKTLPAFVDVREKKIIDNLRLTVPPIGEIRFLLLGFTERERRTLEADIELEGSPPTGPQAFFYKEEVTWAAPAGKGRVTFSHEALGTVTRSLDIKKEEVFEITIQRSDFATTEPEACKVAVTLKKPDGKPLANATMGFNKKMRAIPFLARSEHGGVTDSKGLLQIEKIEPGIWSAWCTLFSPENYALLMKNRNLLDLNETLGTAVLHGIEIPESPGPDFKVDLVYPDGVIRGLLCDKTTVLPLEDAQMLLRWIMVNDPDQHYRVCGLSLANSGSRFELTGIKAGRYQFGAAVFGYEHYLSEVFSFDEGDVLDLGKIMLVPVGTMEIEVVDPGGEPLQQFRLNWEGKSSVISIYGLDAIPISKDKTVFSNLPFGPLSVEVSSWGFEPKTITCDIEPNKRAKALVVLEPLENGK